MRDAEEYYQQMYRAEVSSWNLRDRHMAATLDALVEHLDRQHRHNKVVVWEHNSHIGDARATSMATNGELNVGQLARQRYRDDVFLIGFSTYDGQVTAASTWGGPAQRKRVRPALPESHEALFHSLDVPRFWLPTADPATHDALAVPRLQRAIGVIYRPETERQSHYVTARLADQFDAVIHLDHTQAVTPLEPTSAGTGRAARDLPDGPVGVRRPNAAGQGPGGARRWSRNQSAAKSAATWSVPGSSKRWVARGTVTSRFWQVSADWA